MGVSNTLLRAQRRAAAAAAGPAAGTAGQNLDLALLLADGAKGGAADPAYEGHAPIGMWAAAAWDTWLPDAMMLRMVADAQLALASAARPWAVVRGPGAAFVASAARLGWTIHDAFSLTTDD